MAITISNPLLMNRMSKRQARAHAKSMPRGRNGRFLKKGRKGAASRRGKALTKSRSRTKARKSSIRKGRKGAARRRMTAREVQALARKHGLVAKVHRKKKRTMSDEHKALMKARRAENQAKLKARYGSGVNVFDRVFDEKPMSREELMAARQSASRDLAAIGVRMRMGGATETEIRDATARAAAKLPEHLRPNRKNRRNRRNGRRNPAIYSGVESLAARLPLIGGFAKPLMLGATAAAIHFGAAKGLKALAAQSSTVDAAIDTVAPVGYTVMGATVGFALPALLNFLPRYAWGQKVVRGVETIISVDDLEKVGQVATIAGAVLDVYRYFRGTSSEFGTIEMGGLSYGDGTAYEVVPYGTIEMGGLSYGTIEMGGLAYGAAEMADAAYCNDDLSGEEAAAAKAGAGQYMARFPMMNAARATRVAGRPSSMAGKHGLRWGWLIKLVGWEKFQQIASLSPGHRVRVIAALRMQAMQSLQSTIDKTALALPALQSPVTSDLSGLNYSGLAYGGFVYAGEGM